MQNPSILCFGEVLWDLLPTGAVAGGAPMNVAFHANQLGLPSKMISRVGDDDLGKELRRFLESMGLSTELIQTDSTFPTGIVNVTLDANGLPSYEIVSPVAWDYIEPDEQAKAYLGQARALIFGSLACRMERNKKMLLDYLELPARRVFDVNLRMPFYSQSLIEELMTHADIVKMNDEELYRIAGWFGAPGTEKAQVEFLCDKFDLDLLILTKGAAGAACLDHSGYREHPGFRVTVQDTIGSGDAFLAAFLSKYLNGEKAEDCLVFAGAVGALVATKRGGTPTLQAAEIEALMQAAP